jgi:hypothetical protein
VGKVLSRRVRLWLGVGVITIVSPGQIWNTKKAGLVSGYQVSECDYYLVPVWRAKPTARWHQAATHTGTM